MDNNKENKDQKSDLTHENMPIKDMPKEAASMVETGRSRQEEMAAEIAAFPIGMNRNVNRERKQVRAQDKFRPTKMLHAIPAKKLQTEEIIKPKPVHGVPIHRANEVHKEREEQMKAKRAERLAAISARETENDHAQKLEARPISKASESQVLPMGKSVTITDGPASSLPLGKSVPVKNEPRRAEKPSQRHREEMSTPLKQNASAAATRQAGGTSLGWISLFFAIAALFIWPVLMGITAAILGFIAYRQGNKTLGVWSIIIGFVALAFYLIQIPL